ncbi:MAG TPA: alpha/beta fold hydrolase [Ramlibacter sp.]|jgi:pimeloyl-ACP methyl ester carboxylesterase|uniref:esterase/lipase family protein n=1 Tax=Ramlibacter sp. TaxID=1917967 RepID=UPI002D2758EF|nr:alpha/beta fold hydrolase [Ramlibacter sp.]HZY20651.1 alpha/beta fold hydrolase [Ramlibacter sp.]
MPRTSRLARLQQALVLGLLAVALAWGWAWWPARPALAVAGAVLALFAHSPLLAIELLLMRWASRHDPAPRSSVHQMLAAWWHETWADVRVFGWRQPFAWQRCPDQPDTAGAHARRGIVFIHGFVCNRGFWRPWLERAAARGHPFIAVNLEPVFGSIDDYAETIEQAVARLATTTRQPPVLVCHSMGGLAARAWLRRHDGARRVAKVVTIGTPHRGTWLARFSRVANGRQMRIGGEWLRELERTSVAAAGLFTCWYSNCDNVVFPPGVATLDGADNRLVPGAAHVELAFRDEVIERTFALLD